VHRHQSHQLLQTLPLEASTSTAKLLHGEGHIKHKIDELSFKLSKNLLIFLVHLMNKFISFLTAVYKGYDKVI